MIDLSVLICSTHTRYQSFGLAIQDQIWRQYAALPADYQDRVEILMLTDNKKMMLGQKRNDLVDIAQGRYVAFVDDDDRLEYDYLSSLIEATDSDADVITFLVSVSLNGEPPKICRYSKEYLADRNTATGYERLPNHICCVKIDIASQVSFPNVVYGEDCTYSKLLRPMLRTEHAIDRVLYHYDFNADTTETQQHLKARLSRRPRDPVVDVVILSKADSPEMHAMTQNAINTCIAGANRMPVNVIVLEQQPGVVYRMAQTVEIPGEFNYNRFANRGVMLGSAPWIMIANNDLVFNDGWLHHLLIAEHPVVSPKCPHDKRQQQFTENTTGCVVGQHFSGWCFMMQRQIWREIGGFDDDVRFWCSDNAVMQQLQAIDIEPMIVPAAQVEHLYSMTLKRVKDDDDLTWRQVAIFNDKYDQHILEHHPMYQRWMQSERTRSR